LRNIADDNKKMLETQFSRILSIEKAIPIEGRAIFIEDPIKGFKKEPRDDTKRAILFSLRLYSKCSTLLEFMLRIKFYL